MIIYKQLSFEQLSSKLLYQILQLRNEVFIVEQNAPYLDLDNKDFIAKHFIALNSNEVVSYGRVMFDIDKNAMSLGRLVTNVNHRRKGIAQRLMQDMLSYLNNTFQNETIIISAQSYLEGFYQSFGFVSTGNIYLEDGLPHIQMLRYKKEVI